MASAPESVPRFHLGDRVRVRADAPPGHVRTPTYVKGKTGLVAKVHGVFRNPETLAYSGDGLPRQPLYRVSFHQQDLWPRTGAPKDTLVLDLYEHWLEPVL